MEFFRLSQAYIHDPFHTHFSHEITKKVARNEPYTFIVGLFGYHKIWIIKEDKMNTIFSMEWWLYAYNLMPFGPSNAPIMFSRIMFVMFNEYIHNFLELYFQLLAMYILLKGHMAKLMLVMERRWLI